MSKSNLFNRAGRNAFRVCASIFMIIVIGGLILLNTNASDAQTAPIKAAPKPVAQSPTAQTPTTKAPDSKAQVAIVESQPVIHARSAAISSCLPAISELSRMTLDAPHIAMSVWNKTNANEHMFSSISGLKYDNTIAPRAVSIIAAAPNSKKTCDGESVQIQPSSLSCDAIQKNLTGANMKVQDLNGISVVQGDNPLRFALLPTSGNGCTVVSIGSYFAK
jgi:hypothetical protein